MQHRKAGQAGSTPIAIKDLLSYRLHKVANLLSRGAAMRYRREYDVSLWEWRCIALLGAYAPMSLNELAKSSGLDKSQASRVASGLIDRGLVLRSSDDSDGRGIRLSLSKPGMRVYEGLMQSAAARNGAFLARLSAEELKCLDGILAKVGDEASRLIEDEKKAAVRPRSGRRAA